ncbi:bifunctional glutamate N-acetyltransferase/amino-acid acetyltransferase ArgJ [Sorangium sp. So ce385]|uniref:bifunctional glutamate N-acetyltransferase/amino-acid acetyltransferase ArgJ n=1 Tax=Sorangium sp. So ce385 TaxID=3133308 RepID=UPI003F5C8BC3
MSFEPVAGFRFGAISAGIRKDGRIDVALAVADQPAVVAGMFTRNLVRAAPVDIATQRVRSGRARAVVANSGCANACTGEAGWKAALDTTRAVAEAIGASEDEVLPASTGVIGAVLPAHRIVERVPELTARLSPKGYLDFAQAICTTDRWPKLSQRKLAGGATLLGIGKGAGMIHPDVGPPHATMLVFLFTDAVLDPGEANEALAASCDVTFNACTVDGDTSTNDTVLLLSSGASQRRASRDELTAALTEVCGELARSMVADGEGSTHVAEIRVRGLSTRDAARAVARTVATSMLVKTALFGKDANWGRLLAAAGRAGVPFDPTEAQILVGGIPIVQNGAPIGAEAERKANEVLARDTYVIELVLGSGPGDFSYLTSDLGHGYVDVNAGYRS